MKYRRKFEGVYFQQKHWNNPLLASEYFEADEYGPKTHHIKIGPVLISFVMWRVE